MKKYNIVVNGTMYQVEVEEVGGVPSAPKAAPAPAPAPAAAAPAPAPAAPAAPVAAGDKAIVAPMPGTVLDVRVSAGQAVKAGDILLILEAMKMENEILAPHDGTIDTVSVAKGSAVNSGDALVSYK